MAIDPKNQLPGGADTVNEDFLDSLVRHQIGLMRLSGGIRNQIVDLLNATESDVADAIRRRLRSGGGIDGATAARLRVLERIVRRIREAAWDRVDQVWLNEMVALAQAEPVFMAQALRTVSPVLLDTVIPSTALLTSLVKERPFDGKTLKQWSSKIREDDISRIMDQVRIGMVQGEGAAAIARRVVGTVGLRGTDGVTEITRRNAAAITRTAVNHFSNQARREFFKSNKSVLKEEQYVATLDSRTTPVCRSLDGERYPVGEGPIPPLHFNCRSLRVGVLDGEVLGQRPQKPVTERGLLRQYTERNGLKTVTRRRDLPRGHRGSFDQFSRRIIRDVTGPIPAKVTYQQWLTRQSAAFQDDVLGPTRARLFRRGGLTLDKFVNRSGDQINLHDLARLDRQAFINAGLDPEDF
jgi:SPP1 gp7 family putative phage head morphogenesis protein